MTYGLVSLFDQEGKQIGETALTRMEESEYKKIQYVMKKKIAFHGTRLIT